MVRYSVAALLIAPETMIWRYPVQHGRGHALPATAPGTRYLRGCVGNNRSWFDKPVLDCPKGSPRTGPYRFALNMAKGDYQGFKTFHVLSNPQHKSYDLVKIDSRQRTPSAQGLLAVNGAF